MNEEDLERYETEVELQIYKEYRDVLPMFKFVVETERRFYLANKVEINTQHADGSHLLRDRARRCLGLGHVPSGAVPPERPGA